MHVTSALVFRVCVCGCVWVCRCVRARVRACARARVCECVRTCAPACGRVHACACMSVRLQVGQADLRVVNLCSYDLCTYDL
jgi:hypothetical protein